MVAIHVEPCNVGNLIFRYMFANHVQRRLPGSRLVGFPLKQFGFRAEPCDTSGFLTIGTKHRVDVGKLLRRLKRGKYPGLSVDCYAQRLEYFESERPRFARELSTDVQGVRTDAGDLVMSIRADDILRAIHPDYWPLPIRYYRNLLRETGLRPVFVGQIGDDYYGNALRTAFPGARFITGCRWIDDFQTIRNAQNIAVSVSTFSWLAAWLSESAKRIHLPMAGILNPVQRPDIDLVPESDSRYVFHEFPVWKFHGTPEEINELLRG